MSDILDNLSYSEAKKQLEKILADLEQGDVDVDKLDVLLTRARDLVAYCQDKLRRAEKSLGDHEDAS